MDTSLSSGLSGKTLEKKKKTTKPLALANYKGNKLLVERRLFLFLSSSWPHTFRRLRNPSVTNTLPSARNYNFVCTEADEPWALTRWQHRLQWDSVGKPKSTKFFGTSINQAKDWDNDPFLFLNTLPDSITQKLPTLLKLYFLHPSSI